MDTHLTLWIQENGTEGLQNLVDQSEKIRDTETASSLQEEHHGSYLRLRAKL